MDQRSETHPQGGEPHNDAIRLDASRVTDSLPRPSPQPNSATVRSRPATLRYKPGYPTCVSTDPREIKEWIGNGLVTSLYPPVEANCRQLRVGNSSEQRRVRSALSDWTNRVSDQMFYENITKCSYVRKLFSPNNFYISETERNFSLAYALLFNDSPQQIVRLLKVIYRPHNIYCLHPDGKANPQLIQAFRQLASCLDNVFVPRELVKVTYMHFSMVEAQMWCFQQLATTYRHWQWKYAMNLCGKELPFSSNRVIVDTLRRLNRASVVYGAKLRAKQFKEVFESHYSQNPDTGRLFLVGPRREPVPFGVKLYKSSNYISASRQFVEFLLRDKQVQAIRKYMSTAKKADEVFFATAYMLPGAPKGDGTGIRAGQGREVRGPVMLKTYFTTGMKCTRKSIHYVCILNILDLPMLFKHGTRGTTIFFYNKYLMEYDHVVMDCMERRIVEQNQLEYKRDCLA